MANTPAANTSATTPPDEPTYIGKPRPCALTPQQDKLWSDTRAALIWHCPAFSHIFYSMLDTVGQKSIAMFTKDVPIAATDGSALLLNPDTFFQYNLNERLFICAHEIMHCIWNHCGLMHSFRMRGKVAYPDGKTIPYIHELMNVATDLVINDALIESKVGQYNKDWLHDTTIATAKDSALDAYRKLYEENKGKKGSGKMPGGVGFDQHLAPGTSQGKDPVSAQQQRNAAEWDTQVAAAVATAKAQGKLPAGLERLLKEVLDPKVDWREHIRSLFARKVGSGAYDWRRSDRRLITRDIYAPGRSGFGAGDVVVAVDTSGSIGQRELDMFMAEMSGILEDVRPKRLFIMWCDAKVHRTDEANDVSDLRAIRCKGAPGGGGTSFVPVFEEIAKQGIQPEALVYLTDSYGTFPDRAPQFPVIWGNITPNAKYPWGDVVDVPKQAA
jgi:predicted metal-dependent peptidase